MTSGYFAALGALLLGASSLVAKPVDLSRFPGKYVGTATLTYGPTVLASGSSVMVFKASKKGTSGNLAVSATLMANGGSGNASNNFTFAKNKTLTIALCCHQRTTSPCQGFIR